MDNDLKLFIDEIKENTGVELTVFGNDGELIFGERFDENFIKNYPDISEGVVSDKGRNATLFTIKFRNKNYTAVIYGSGKTESNYAYLISELSEKDFSRGAFLTKEEFLKSAIYGEASYFQISKYMKKYGLSNKSVCVLLISAASGRNEDVLNVINNYCSGGSDFAIALEEKELALFKFSEPSAEYHSVAEFSQFLVQSVYEEIGIKVEVAVGSTVKSVADISTSFIQATAVERMSRAINSKGSVHSFKEYMLIKMIEDLPKYKLNEYLELLLDEKAREIFSDEEMVNTAEEFLENNLNVSETSRKIYFHRNTLTYRLDKIEKATGLNIKKFSDAVTFRLITILSRLVR